MKSKAFSRDERRIQIVTWFAIRVQNANLNPATMYEIARGLGLSPSTHLKKIIEGMVADEVLISHRAHRPGRWEGYEYMLFPGTYSEPKKRTIALKSRGKLQGQLELF